MKLSYQKASEISGNISFPILHCWNPMTRCVSIAADVDGRRILCSISETVIEALFGTSAPDAVVTVATNRKVFENAAARSVGRSRFVTGGTVNVLIEDFENLPA